jgi:hypothetical protein
MTIDKSRQARTIRLGAFITDCTDDLKDLRPCDGAISHITIKAHGRSSTFPENEKIERNPKRPVRQGATTATTFPGLGLELLHQSVNVSIDREEKAKRRPRKKLICTYQRPLIKFAGPTA